MSMSPISGSLGGSQATVQKYASMLSSGNSAPATVVGMAQADDQFTTSVKVLGKQLSMQSTAIDLLGPRSDRGSNLDMTV